jgi:glutathione S-transferase
MRILWGIGTARTIRPHWAFHELNLDFECRPIDPRSGETRTPEFTVLTARQKVPLLQDNHLVLTESAAIIWYLSETYGQDHNRLVPTDPQDKARCLEWCFFVQSELDETSLYVMRRHSDMRRTYGEAPTAIEAAASYFRKQMRTVERALETNPTYILGERFTAADILLSTCVTWAVRYDIPLADRVVAYNARMTARPAYARAEQTNGPL